MYQRALQLIDRIYAAAVDPDVWQAVTEGVSDIFGGSPTMLSFVIPDEEAGATTDGCASCPAATDRRMRPPSGIKDC